MQQRLRYVFECSVCTAAALWLTFEFVGPKQGGFTPPESSLHWSWTDLAVRSSPSLNARQVAQIETGESIRVIRRPDGWAAILDSVALGIVGFVPNSALHPTRMPTFAMAYSHVGTVLDALRTDSAWVSIEVPYRLRHVSNGMFEAVGMFAAGHGEPLERQYRLQLQYTDDNSWEPVSLTIEHLAN